MTVAEIVGYVAAIGTTGAFIPQAFKVFKTKSTNDLSLGTYLSFNASVILWCIYGFLVNSLPIILANGITCVMASYILFIIIKNRQTENH